VPKSRDRHILSFSQETRGAEREEGRYVTYIPAVSGKLIESLKYGGYVIGEWEGRAGAESRDGRLRGWLPWVE